MKRFTSFLFSLLSLPALLAASWSYIQIDDDRGKWGDWAEPQWLRYFGLDAGDFNHDGMLDIVSGRYVYLNSGGDMNAPWTRIDLGFNTDAALTLDVDGDAFADLIATSLPTVYWVEALNTDGTRWSFTPIAAVKATGHVNGQGFRTADLVPGGKKEILIAGGDGIHLLQVPADPNADPWPAQLLFASSDEGFAVGDLDGDGNLDIAASRYVEKDGANAPLELFWWRNPGDLASPGTTFDVHRSAHDIDRIEIADLNGDGRADIVYSEERYPGLEPDAQLVWLEAPPKATASNWKEHLLTTQFSMNNLDVGDVDNDGDLDIVTNEHKGSDYALQIFTNDGHGHFAKTVIDTGKEMHLGAQLADFDGDGDLEIFGHAWDHYRFLHFWRNDLANDQE